MQNTLYAHFSKPVHAAAHGQTNYTSALNRIIKELVRWDLTSLVYTQEVAESVEKLARAYEKGGNKTEKFFYSLPELKELSQKIAEIHKIEPPPTEPVEHLTSIKQKMQGGKFGVNSHQFQSKKFILREMTALNLENYPLDTRLANSLDRIYARLLLGFDSEDGSKANRDRFHKLPEVQDFLKQMNEAHKLSINTKPPINLIDHINSEFAIHEDQSYRLALLTLKRELYDLNIYDYAFKEELRDPMNRL